MALSTYLMGTGVAFSFVALLCWPTIAWLNGKRDNVGTGMAAMATIACVVAFAAAGLVYMFAHSPSCAQLWGCA